MSILKSGKRVVVIVATLLLFATAGLEPVVARPSDRNAKENNEIQEIGKIFDSYVSAWNKGNYETLAGIYANDRTVSVFWPDPARPSLLVGWTRISSNLKDVFGFLHGGLDLDFNDRQIQIYGDTALLTSSWVWHHPADPAFGSGRVTVIFHKYGKKWLIVHEHSSVTPFDSK
jgi:ketosteroid isomerase-like protein